MKRVLPSQVPVPPACAFMFRVVPHHACFHFNWMIGGCALSRERFSMSRRLPAPTARLLPCLPSSPQPHAVRAAAHAAAQTSLLPQRNSWRRHWRLAGAAGLHTSATEMAEASSGPATPATSEKSVLFISSVWPERSSSAAGQVFAPLSAAHMPHTRATAFESTSTRPGNVEPCPARLQLCCLFHTAGVRTSDLLTSFQRHGWAASYACSSAPNEHAAALSSAGVATHGVPPNREALLAEALNAAAPTVVVFDRFYAEEAFSFRVRELAPHALRVLDMQARAAWGRLQAWDVQSCSPWHAHSPLCNVFRL